MLQWNQPICDDCWLATEGNRVPCRVIEAKEEACSYCGEATKSGIYVRADPSTVPFPKEAE